MGHRDELAKQLTLWQNQATRLQTSLAGAPEQILSYRVKAVFNVRGAVIRDDQANSSTTDIEPGCALDSYLAGARSTDVLAVSMLCGTASRSAGFLLLKAIRIG